MVVYLILYGAGVLFASSAHYYMSGMSLILAALYLYFYDYRRSGNPLHLRALFSLFWVGGGGISCFKPAPDRLGSGDLGQLFHSPGRFLECVWTGRGPDPEKTGRGEG